MEIAPIVTDIVTAVTSFVTGFATAIVDTASTLLFVNTGTTESPVYSLSALAIIIFVGLGLAVAYWVVDKVIGLIKIRKSA